MPEAFQTAFIDFALVSQRTRDGIGITVKLLWQSAEYCLTDCGAHSFCYPTLSAITDGVNYVRKATVTAG